MEKEIEEIKKAMFINWAWAYNPQILSKEDFDWFYEYILKKYVQERTPEATQQPIIVSREGEKKEHNASKAGEKGVSKL